MEDAAKVEPAEAKADYGLHSKIISEMRGVLKDGAELGYIWVNILKPDLVDLMNLFIGKGFSIQKKKWLLTGLATVKARLAPAFAILMWQMETKPAVLSTFLNAEQQLIFKLAPFSPTQSFATFN